MVVPFPQGSYLLDKPNVVASSIGGSNGLNVCVPTVDNVITRLNLNSNNIENRFNRSDANLDFSVLCDPVSEGATIISIDCIFANINYSKKLHINVLGNSK